MSFLTSIALRRPTVAVLAIFLVLGSGIFAYRTLQVELFPQIEFPLVTVFAAYPSADPEAVVQHVTGPIERAVADTPGLESTQSTSFEGNTAVFATFEYGTDMAGAQSAIAAAVNDIAFPAGVEEPTVGRFNPDQIPVIQFSVVSDRDVSEVQGIVQSRILPAISEVEGVMDVVLTGEVERSVRVVADVDKLASTGISLFQISAALSENNLTLPAGLVFDGTQAVIAKTTHTLDSVQDVRDLVVGASESGVVRLSDVADVTLDGGRPKSISRTNGKPGIGVAVSKKPDANTLDVTTAINDVLDGVAGLPSDVQIIVVSDQGPDIKEQVDTLVREAMFGFLFAVSVVFAFMLTIRPTVFPWPRQYAPPYGRNRPVDPVERLHRHSPDVVAGHVPQFHDPRRARHLRGARRGRLHSRTRKRLSPHSGPDGRGGVPRSKPPRRSALRYSPPR